jgi:hypothetical protein
MWKVLNVSVLERYSCKESDGDLVGGIFVDDGDICFKHASRAGTKDPSLAITHALCLLQLLASKANCQ